MFYDDEVVLISSGAMTNQFILDLIKVKSEREDVLCNIDSIWET